jgi:hypothetical protein
MCLCGRKKRPSRSDSFCEEIDDTSKDLKGQREFQTSDFRFLTFKTMFSMFSMRLKKRPSRSDSFR